MDPLLKSLPCKNSLPTIPFRRMTHTKSSVSKNKNIESQIRVSQILYHSLKSSFKGSSSLKCPPEKTVVALTKRAFSNRRVPGTVVASFGSDLLQNEILATTTIAVVVTQFLKPITAAISGQGFNWKLVVKSGGMPSSHSAVVTSLATAFCLQRGASDPIFGAFVVYACVVMYDAQGVRRAVGKQAEVLNTLVVPELARFPTPKEVSSQQANADGGALPPTAIGVELTNPQKVDLQFYENGSSGTSSASSYSSTSTPLGRQENGSSIGEELARASGQLELAFVESREVGGGEILEEERSLSVGIGLNTLQTSSNVKSLEETTEKKSYNNGSGRREEGGKGVVEISGLQANRSPEFWAAAKNEPSMREGEVVEQELGEREGWRHIPLKESVGHTKPEVLVGAIAGIILSLVLHEFGFYHLM